MTVDELYQRSQQISESMIKRDNEQEENLRLKKENQAYLAQIEALKQELQSRDEEIAILKEQLAEKAKD